MLLYINIYYILCYIILHINNIWSWEQVVKAGEEKNNQDIDKTLSKKFKPGEKNPEEDGQDEETQNWDHNSEITFLSRLENLKSSFMIASAKLTL